MEKILVVDDNAENRALATATLEDEGYNVVLAKNGEEALRVFAGEQVDCVLLDIRMPGMDGFAVCERLREMPRGVETPIVFLTAQRDVETFDRAIRAGGDDFLIKPVMPSELAIRVQAALKLRRMSAELREHYELVRHQRDDLMRLQLQKEKLTAFVVHDLKNPVNAMDLHAQFLLRDKTLAPQSRESVMRIRDEARALLRLVLNLLDISKSEEGKLAPRVAEVDLAKLTNEIVEAHALRASMTDVTLHTAIDVGPVRADVDLLRRVIENLLDNAIRHTPEKGDVTVSAVRNGTTVELRVADTGGGISPEMRDKIFERFVQAEVTENLVTRTGRGLGLAFCKVAIEAHGGKICVENAPSGTVFLVSLPQ